MGNSLLPGIRRSLGRRRKLRPHFGLDLVRGLPRFLQRLPFFERRRAAVDLLEGGIGPRGRGDGGLNHGYDDCLVHRAASSAASRSSRASISARRGGSSRSIARPPLSWAGALATPTTIAVSAAINPGSSASAVSICARASARL